MEPSARGLDEVVDLLGRWSGASGPSDRLQVVTEAARVLRDLQSTDSRVLARQLYEHGAPNAAQKIAQQTGGRVTTDQLNDAAYALLSVDQRELDDLARELRDPHQRREVFERAGVAMAAAADAIGSTPPTAPTPPPDPTTRQDIPPPPAASPPRSPAPPPSPASATPRAPDHSDDRPSDEPDASIALEPTQDPAPEPAQGPAAPPVSRRRTGATPTSQFADELTRASNGRERLAMLDQHRLELDHRQLVEVLQAVPDGWQRRTALRKLLTARRIHPIDDASEVVAAFGRRSDRFAAAASLTRSGLADVVPLLAHLDPADARRLRRRYST
jgi:hypothetical protein